MRLNQVLPAVGLLACSLATPSAFAQVDPLTTTAGLKAACERNLGNLVVIATDTTVNTGYPAVSPEPVRTGCRIQLLNGADIQFDKVGMAFAGPLVIIGSSQSGLQLQEANLEAASVLVDLVTVNSAIKMEQSRIGARTGDVELRLGTSAKFEVSGARMGGSPVSNAAIAAAGRISVTALRGLSAGLKDTALVAGSGVAVTPGGTESSVGLENTVAHAQRGAVRFEMGSSKSKLEIKGSTFTAPGGAAVLALRGSESSLSMVESTVRAGANVQVIGLGPWSHVLIEKGSLAAATGVVLGGELGSAYGTLTVGDVQINSGGGVQMLSGTLSKTSVFSNRITANGLVRAAASTWGTCEAKDNTVTAPLVQLCP